MFVTLVSNKNDKTPRILHNQLRVTLTHTTALPIRNERIPGVAASEREREIEEVRERDLSSERLQEKEKRVRHTQPTA